MQETLCIQLPRESDIHVLGLILWYTVIHCDGGTSLRVSYNLHDVCSCTCSYIKCVVPLLLTLPLLPLNFFLDRSLLPSSSPPPPFLLPSSSSPPSLLPSSSPPPPLLLPSYPSHPHRQCCCSQAVQHSVQSSPQLSRD